MEEIFKPLLETKDLWLPALGGLVARLSATQPGRTIQQALKDKLKWLKEPESSKAFFEAFEAGVEKYSRERSAAPAARSAARIIADCVTDESSGLDFAGVLDQIFAASIDQGLISSVSFRHVVSLEDALCSSDQIAQELTTLLRDYLRPAFRNHRYFTERVGFAEIVSILGEIRAALASNQEDLEKLRNDYYRKIGDKFDIIPMQGISPKIQNQTIGIRMEDVFIPLRASPDWHSVLQHKDVWKHPDFPSFKSHISLAGFTWDFPESFTVQDLELANVIWRKTITSPGVSLKQPKNVKISDSAYKVYIDSNLLINAPAISFESNTIKSENVEQLLQFPRVVVRGNPGSGKSTLTRYIAWALARGKAELVGKELNGRTPVVIRAIEFGEALEQGKVESLEEYLTETSGRFAPVIKHDLACGKAILLIDGLDEVSKVALRVRVKERVDDFIADPVFAENRVVVTTRIVGYERSGLTGRFRHFTISELDDSQIREFIRRWYGAIEREVPETIESESETRQLTQAVMRNESILRMARNPLLLTIIALIKWQGRTLPEQRVLLYDAAAQTLIRSWPLTQRRVEFEELFVREWLAPIAFHILSDRTGDLIDEYSLLEELSKIMRRLRSMTDIQAKTASREMLDNISEHSGFLLPRDRDKDGNNLYGFLHQNFAEYLAAYYMAGRWEDGELELIDYAHDPYWREVFLLIGGHLGIQRRAKAGGFVRAVRSLNSSSYEDLIHRDLLLACSVLADGTPVGPADVVEALLSELLAVWEGTSLISLRSDIEKVVGKLKGTEYAEVIARLAVERKMSPYQLLAVAKKLGPDFLVDSLLGALSSEDAHLALSAAELLIHRRRAEAISVALQFAVGKDGYTKIASVGLVLKSGDPRGIPLLLGLLKSLDPASLAQFGRLMTETHPTVTDAVAKQLGSEDLTIQLNAAQLLASWKDRRGIEALLRFADSSDVMGTRILWGSVNGLEIFEDDALVRLLGISDELVRSGIVSELAKRGVAEGINAFFESRDRNPGFYDDHMLGMLAKRRNPKALGILKEQLAGSDQEIRLRAASALAWVGVQSGKDALVRFLDSDDQRSQLTAMDGLVGANSVPLLSRVVALLASSNVGVHLGAVSLLSKLKEPGAVGILASLLDDPRPSVKRTAAELMFSRDEPEIVKAMTEHILELLQDRTDISDSLGISAYQFLKRHLTPRGQIRSSVQQ